MAATNDVYLFVISSLDHPVYRRVQEKRKHLLRHYDIPYTVLINSQESDLNSTDEPTLIPLNEDEILYNGGGFNPFMAQKFLMGVKMLFRSYAHYEDIPNYIIRINATVYVHFPSLLGKLHGDDFPREGVVAGPNWGDIFVQGMLMVFSKDVLFQALKDPRMYSKTIMRLNDDVSLSMLVDPYSKWIDWNKHLCMSGWCATDKDGVYQLDKIQPVKNDKWIFRIREDADGRRFDLQNWDNLMKYFDEPIQSADYSYSPNNTDNTRKGVSVMLWVALFLYVAAVVLIFFARRKHQFHGKKGNNFLLRE